MSFPIEAEGRVSPAALSAARLLGLRDAALRVGPIALETAARPGGAPGRAPGAGTDIREIRPYAEGDPLRSIDAAATARRGAPHVRAYHEDRERAAMLVADFRRPMLWGTRRRFRSVAAAEALAAIGWRALEAGASIGAAAIGGDGVETLPLRNRAASMAQAAEMLARAHAAEIARLRRDQPTPPLGPALLRAAEAAPPMATIFLASSLDAPGEGFEDVLARIARRRRLAVLLIRDAFERDRPAGRFSFFSEDGAARRGGFPKAGVDPRIAALEAAGARVETIDSDCETMAEAAPWTPRS